MDQDEMKDRDSDGKGCRCGGHGQNPDHECCGGHGHGHDDPDHECCGAQGHKDPDHQCCGGRHGEQRGGCRRLKSQG